MSTAINCLAAAVIVSCAFLSACNDDDGSRPAALAIQLDTIEDQAVSGQLAAKSNRAVQYDIVAAPAHGRVAVDRISGKFEYTPDPDFSGSDSFQYVVENDSGRSTAATVTIRVTNVNDAPTLAELPELHNSAVEFATHQPRVIDDVDGDALQVSVIVTDTSVANASFDPATNSLVVEPLRRGKTSITVQVSDAEFSVSRETTFTVEDVTRTTKLAAPAEDVAVVLHNRSDRTVEFKFAHNNFPVFKSDEDMLAYVRSMPLAFEDEPFERVLWRFVRNNAYHSYPLTDQKWHNDPWVVISSLGWGFCSNVSGTYVRLARAAGYEARIWGLTGHVVPEIKIGERWQMFDPDLAVYYYTHDGQIAGVADLVADSSLVTNPTRPVLDTNTQYFPYSQMIADIYASAGDNYIANGVFFAEPSGEREDLTLPPEAQFVYPGNWTAPPIGYDDGIPFEVTSFLQGNLILPARWQGYVPTPWLIADIRGEGVVRIDGQSYPLGSSELTTALTRDQRPFAGLEIVESTTPVEIIMFLNASRYELAPQNTVALTGVDVWAVEPYTTALPDTAKIMGPSAKTLSKPRTIAH